MAKQKKRAVQEPERSCSHDYALKARPNKNHLLPPRTSHDVFHALFLLQHKLPREIAVRVLDAAGFWIWEAIECRDLHYGNMFISDKVRQRNYASLRRLILGVEYRTDEFEQPGHACVRYNWEALVEPQGSGLGALPGRLQFGEARFQLLEEVVEQRGKFNRSAVKPAMQGLKVDVDEADRLNLRWRVSHVLHTRTGHCAHMLYAIV